MAPRTRTQPLPDSTTPQTLPNAPTTIQASDVDSFTTVACAMALIGALLMHILPEVFDGPLTLTLGSIDECPQVQSPQVKSPQVGSTQVECTQVESPQVVLCLTALGTLLATCTLLTSLFCFYERNFALLSFWPFMFCALAACLLINVNNDKALVMLSAAPMMFIVGYMVLVSMFKGRCIKQVDKNDKHTHVE